MSRQGIVIVTSEHTKDFLRDCIMSCLQDKYPIMVVSNMYIVPEAILGVEYVNINSNGCELSGISVGMERFDEFLLLHDTMIVKDKALFDLVFSNPKSVYLSAESM